MAYRISRQARKNRRENWARLEALKRANAADAAAVNLAIQKGVRVILSTAFGDYRVVRVTGDFDWFCEPAWIDAYSLGEQWFAGANDGRWLEILRQAGVTPSRI